MDTDSPQKTYDTLIDTLIGYTGILPLDPVFSDGQASFFIASNDEKELYAALRDFDKANRSNA